MPVIEERYTVHELARLLGRTEEGIWAELEGGTLAAVCIAETRAPERSQPVSPDWCFLPPAAILLIRSGRHAFIEVTTAWGSVRTVPADPDRLLVLTRNRDAKTVEEAVYGPAGAMSEIARRELGIEPLKYSTRGLSKEPIAQPRETDLSSEPDSPDTSGMVQWQAALLEAWPMIEEAFASRPKSPGGREAIGWLNKHGPADVFVRDCNLRNALQWKDGDGNLQTAKLGTVRTVISNWRRAKKIPPSR